VTDSVDTTFRLAAVAASVPEARHRVQELGRRHGATTEVLAIMSLCVTEAVSNAVLHAYRDESAIGEVEIETRVLHGGLCLYVRDHGHGLKPAPRSEGLGLGLPIISQLADQFELRTTKRGGTEVVMHFPFGPLPSTRAS
jgi:anti-sigma regulatory factor (Ser/Thr protein kinase)